MRKHPDVIAALADEGFTDIDLILIDTWTYAGHRHAGHRGPPTRR